MKKMTKQEFFAVIGRGVLANHGPALIQKLLLKGHDLTEIKVKVLQFSTCEKKKH